MNNVSCDGGRRFCASAALWAACLLLIGVLLPQPVAAQGGVSGLRPDVMSRGAGPSEPVRPQDPIFAPLGPQIKVVEVRFDGNRQVSNERMQTYITTRADRVFDPQVLQADVRRLIATRLFGNVDTFREDTPQGVIVTFRVTERGLIRYIRFIGNDEVRDRTLQKECGLIIGDALDQFSIQEAKRRLEDYYHRSGYTLAYVQVTDGLSPGDEGVAFTVNEGPQQRVGWTNFEGNDFVSDRRLRTQIESKPGIFWVIKGKVVPEEVDRDVERLVAYYHSLGFFRVRVGRKVDFNEDRTWAYITFYVEEGPRYQVRNISFTGNHRFPSDVLDQQLELLPGEDYLHSDLQSDLGRIQDLYGSQGYVFADIQPEVKFLEEPGVLDLVYDIQEGEQYRVGDIHIHIDGTYGEAPITSHAVVLNRLSLQPGDILDTRLLEDSKRRLRSSQLFMDQPAQGISPRIAVRPPELEDVDGGQMAQGGQPPVVRGQGPDSRRDSPWQPPAAASRPWESSPRYESSSPLR